LGIERTTVKPGPAHAVSSATRMPAATDSSNGRDCSSAGRNALTTSASCCGFTASTSTSASLAASALSAVVRMPKVRLSSSRPGP
jgi:hypothetical protein